jgi:fatty acid-binding protein DegV
MKKIINSFSSFFSAVCLAKQAADLARNGKYAEAQAMYKD